jgi:hypothetical protein
MATLCKKRKLEAKTTTTFDDKWSTNDISFSSAISTTMCFQVRDIDRKAEMLGDAFFKSFAFWRHSKRYIRNENKWCTSSAK